MNRFEAAVASFTEALDSYRQLAEARPDVYLPNVATTLNNLGTVQANMNRFEAAVASFTKPWTSEGSWPRRGPTSTCRMSR